MPLVIQATPWPLSCQGTRAAPESELAQLLPWSKESETLPLETKQSIHHFSCQEYIQPKKKYCLLNSQQQKPSISPAKQSPASRLSVISTQVLIVCLVAELKITQNKRSREAGRGPEGPGLQEDWEEGGGAALGQDGWRGPVGPTQDATTKTQRLGKKDAGVRARVGGAELPPCAAQPASEPSTAAAS